MAIRKFHKKDTKEVALLVVNTYKKFNSSEFIEKKAVTDYLSHYNPQINSEEELYSNLKRTPFFYVFEEDHKIIGMIRGRVGRIINLFVDGSKHKKGVGRKLVLKYENEVRKQNCNEIKIRASLYATPFYEKMGYKKTTGIRNFRGLKVFPMKKILN